MISIKKLNHIAFILDGNGRWAKIKNKPRTHGHKAGMKNIWHLLLESKKHEISYVSMFCFSTENWNRPKKEVEFLMNFPEDTFSEKQQEKYLKEGIRVVWIGRRDRVFKNTREILEKVEEKTKDCKNLTVFIAMDYGSFEEVESSFKKVFLEIKEQKLFIEEFQINDVLRNLYTTDAPPIDLLVRTGGEQRLSNFMLLQLVYAELYFTKTYWPDFKEKELNSAIEEYYNRDRRFGVIEDEN